MSDNLWYYGSEENKKGPVSKEELKALVAEGAINLETEVYSELSGKWSELSEVMGVSNIDEPAPMQREKELDGHVLEDEEVKARPWVRFFARWIDYVFFIIVIWIITVLLRVPFYNANYFFAFLMTIFVWCFLEALFISLSTSTPGKAILGVTVKKANGHRLTYGEALSRALSVWLLGMGAGLPIIMIITWIVACVKLSNTKMTSWDRRGSIVVHHKKMNWLRVVVTIIIFIGFGAWLTFYGNVR